MVGSLGRAWPADPLHGTRPQIPANRILLKNIAVTGLHWGAYAYSEPEQVPKVRA